MDDAIVYCEASKDGLATRNQLYLNCVNIVANGFQKNIFFQNLSYSDLVIFLSECARKSVIEEKWNEYEVKGVSWFIGNFVDIATKARIDLRNDYDRLFISTFNQYYQKGMNKIEAASNVKSFYDFIGLYQ